MCDSGKLRLRFRRCDDQHIAVYIMVKDEQIGLCKKCWEKLANMDVNWGDGISQYKEAEEEEIQKPILGDDD